MAEQQPSSGVTWVRSLPAAPSRCGSGSSGPEPSGCLINQLDNPSLAPDRGAVQRSGMRPRPKGLAVGRTAQNLHIPAVPRSACTRVHNDRRCMSHLCGPWESESTPTKSSSRMTAMGVDEWVRCADCGRCRVPDSLLDRGLPQVVCMRTY